MQQKFLHTS